MKRHLLIGLSVIISITFTFSSCDDENNSIVPEDRKPSAPSGQVTDITFYTADIKGKLELSKEELNQSEFGLLLSTSEDVMAVNSDKYPIKNFDKDYSFTLSLSGLDSVTTYYYRSYIYYEGNYIYSNVQNFTTRSPLDIIKTGSLSSDSCTVISRIDSKNLIDYIQTYGICYGTTLVPSLKDQFVTTDSLGAENKFNLKLHDIPFDTLVNYRAFVRINNIDFFGPTLKFQGNTVRTGSINITDYTVTSHLKINDGYKELGVCYGMDSIPSIFNQKVNTTTVDNNNDFKLKLVNIPFDTIVYYRAYALTEDSVYYGGINSFGGNTVTTGIIDTVTFQVQSSVRFDDGITQYGVCYSNSERPITLDKTVYVDQPDSAGFYTLSLTNVPFGTVYYRSYVLKDGIAYYGDIRKFEGNSIATGEFNSETLTAKSIIKFSNTYSNPELGICYSNNQEPTIVDKNVFNIIADTACTYEFLLKNMPFGTVYYRAYMLYDGIPHYGEIKQIEGNVVTTNIFVDSILTANSNIKYSIGYDALNLGVCYSNNENPTINDKVVTTNSVDSLNSFSIQLTEIPFGKVYYRSYMMYEGTPQYGAVKSFDGNSITTGSFEESTLSVNSSLKFSAGYKNLNLGVCYSTNEQPTINDKKITTTSVDSLNTFALQLTEIPFGKVYYRSYMMYEGAPQYGEVKTFEGNSITTGSFEDAALTANSSIRFASGYDKLNLGICYSTKEQPTINDRKVSTSSVDSLNTFYLQLTEIPFGKVFYRSYMMFEDTPYYGEVKSFDGNAITTGSFIDSSLVAFSSLKFSMGYKELDLGVCYSNNEQPTINDKKITTSSIDSLNTFALQLKEIPFGKVYYRSYMMYDGKPQYGDVKSFDGNIITTGVCDTASYKTTASIKITKGYDSYDLGICYSNNTQPTINDLKVSTNKLDSANVYAVQLSGIPFGIIYYRSYMMLDGIPHYGEVKSCKGNELITSDYDQQSLAVKTHIRVKDVFDNLTCGVCYGENATPTINDRKVTTNVIDSNNDYTLMLTNNPVGTKIYYRSYVLWNGIPYYGNTKSFDKEVRIGEAVDLGLSVKWATFNLGGDMPEDFGVRYKWGETKKGKDVDPNGDLSQVIDYKRNLKLEYDAANANWGDGWRIPTKDEWLELKNKCSWTRVLQNNIKGFLISGNGNSIFLPENGYQDEGHETDLTWRPSYEYWTSNLKWDNYPILFEEFMMDDDVMGGVPLESSSYIRPVLPYDGNYVTSMAFENEEESFIVNDKNAYIPIIFKNGDKIISVSDQNEILWSSDNETVAQVTDGKLTCKKAGSCTITALYNSLSASVKVEIVDAYVDLGLSVNWATFNVGARSPEAVGNYYWWGSVTKTLKFNRGYNYGSYSKYNNDDLKTVLDLDDDVAHVELGASWRMPMKEEFNELKENCEWTWTNRKGVNGMLITSKVPGYEDKSIFIPANTYQSSSASGMIPIYVLGEDLGYYWSSSLSPEYIGYGMGLTFSETGSSVIGFDRDQAFFVRPVQPSTSWLSNVTVTISSNKEIMLSNKSIQLSAEVRKSDEVIERTIKWSSDNPSVAKVDGTGKVYTLSVGTAHISASYSTISTECTIEVKEESDIEHEYVDLGLSVNWAKCNLGATSEDGYGDHYAWGEKEPQKIYNSSHYSTSDPDYDAANVKWGGNWRLPSIDEFKELINNCSWNYTDINGVNGYKITGVNGNYIFLPAAGYKLDDYQEFLNKNGYYTTSSLDENYPGSTNQNIYFGSGGYGSSTSMRCTGLSVRPVCPKE